MWQSIEDLKPDAWLWIGDAVYVDKESDGGVDKVKHAGTSLWPYPRRTSDVQTVQ